MGFSRENIEEGDPGGPGDKSPDYIFAHELMPDYALSDPLGCLTTIASDVALNFFETALDAVADYCGKRTAFEASNISVYPCQVNDLPCGVITFPKPKHASEVYMIGVVLTSELNGEDVEGEYDPGEGRYFMLEKGADLPRRTTMENTVLGERTADGSHVNHGSAPKVDVEDFLLAIADVLDLSDLN